MEKRSIRLFRTAALSAITAVTILLCLAFAGRTLISASEEESAKDPFESLPVIFIANESRGSGNGSSPENAMGNASDYVAGYPKNSSGNYVNQTSKTAIARAYAAISETGGTIVVCGEVEIGTADTNRNSAPCEYTVGGIADKKQYKITSVYGGIDYRESAGAKIVLDQVSNPGLGLRFRMPVLIEKLTLDYKYGKGNKWYGSSSASLYKTNTLIIAFWGKKSEIGEGVTVNSIASEGAGEGCYPSLYAGDRFEEVLSTDLTVKSGTWFMAVAGSHGMTEAYPGTVGGNSSLKIEGGKVEAVLGEGGLESYYGKYASIEGELTIVIGKGAEIGSADGSPVKGNSAKKTLIYDVDALDSRNIRNFESVFPSGILYGDANGDGKVSALDLIRLKLHLISDGTNGDGLGIYFRADTDGNGVVDALDVVRLKRYFAEYDYKTGSSAVLLGPENSGGNTPETQHSPEDVSSYFYHKEFDVPTGDLRQYAVDHMLKQANVVWKNSSEFSIVQDVSEQGYSFKLTYEKDKVYTGLPYSNSYSMIPEFERYVDPERVYRAPDSTVSWYDVPGVQCNTSIMASVQRFSKIIGTSLAFSPIDPEFDAVKVGTYETSGYNSSEKAVKGNGSSVMYRSYGLLQKGDIIYRGPMQPHLRMIVENHPVYNSSGSINASSSYVLTVEQTSSFDKTRTDVNTTWWINHKYTYSKLYSTFYLPVSVKEYENPNTEKFFVGLSEELKPEALSNGVLDGYAGTNSVLRYVILEILDKDGNIASRSVRHTMPDYDDRMLYSSTQQTFISGMAKKLFAPLTPGKYTLVITVGIPLGEAELVRVDFTYGG